MKKAILWVILLLVVAALCVLLFAPGPRFADVLPALQSLQPFRLQKEQAPDHAEIELIGDSTVVVEYGEDYTDPGANAWLVSADGTRQPLAIEPSTVDTYRLGTSDVTYSIDMGGVTVASVSRTVTVRDSVAPVITLLGEPGEQDYTAVDNADGDLTDQVLRTEKEDRFVYTVRDSSGNEARVERLKAPQLSIVDGERVQVTADYRFNDPGFTAVDMYGRDLSDRVVVEGKVTPWHPGDYELVYTVTDDFGQTVTAKRTIEIVKAELPETVLQDKVIYLTFDDGPAESTEAMLDMLAKYDVQVTFFVTYSDPRYVDLIGRAYREGHTIGLHGYAHNASLIYASEEAYFEYFDKMQEIIFEQTGTYAQVVRFVGGSSNSASIGICPGIMTALAEDLTNIGYRYYDWNIQPEIAAYDIDEAYITLRYNAARICEEGEAAPISLQHDPGGWNVLVVEKVIQWGLENGYTFKGIDLTTPEVHHRICN